MLNYSEIPVGKFNARVVLGPGLEGLRAELLHVCMVSSSLKDLITNLDTLSSKVRGSTGKRISVGWLRSDLPGAYSSFILTESRVNTEPCLKSWPKRPDATDMTLCESLRSVLTRSNILRIATSSVMERAVKCRRIQIHSSTVFCENCPLSELLNELCTTCSDTPSSLPMEKRPLNTSGSVPTTD